MEVISKTLASRMVTQEISNSNQNPLSVKCWRCRDTGMRLRDAETGQFVQEISVENAGSMMVAENCLCVRRRIYKAQLRAIPPAFHQPKLARMQGQSWRHILHEQTVNTVKRYPDDSFLLTGKNGVGKTYIGWALYRYAISQRRPAVACTVRDLISEFRRVEVGVSDGETLKTPRVTAEMLRKPQKPWLIFFDEFEKARPTEFAAEQLFNVIDAARAFNHQLVITSNMTSDELRAHWSRIDEIWGNSIMTRLQGCHEVRMF